MSCFVLTSFFRQQRQAFSSDLACGNASRWLKKPIELNHGNGSSGLFIHTLILTLYIFGGKGINGPLL